MQNTASPRVVPERARLPAPSREAEIVLLAVFAMDFALPQHLRELTRAIDLLAIEPSDLAAVLDELREHELIVYDAHEHTVELTPLANAHVLALAEQALPDHILGQRELQEQAEALVIWRLARP